MTIDYSKFVGVRVRCQRIEDAKLFSGWVKSFAAEALTIQFEDDVLLAVGDRVAFEIQGQANNVFVIGEVSVADARSISANLNTNMRLTNSVESARFRAAQFGIFCDLELSGESYEMEVQDISMTGIGLMSSVPFERGAIVGLTIYTHVGTATATGEVRYCKQVPGEDAAYRLGIKLQFDERVSRSRWGSMFTQAA